jgi:tight adherence protein B
MTVLIWVLGTTSVVLLLVGTLDIAAAAVARRRLVASVLDSDRYGATPRFDRWDGWFARTRTGKWLQRELTLAGSDRRPLTVVLWAVVLSAVAVIVTWNFLAPALSVVGVAIGAVVLRAWLQRGQERRREAFIAQMPELARVIANATHAGLAVPTAIAVAAEELADPARTELSRVSTRLSFGTSLERAMSEMRDRVASREVSVLVSTLLVSSRAGGSVVTSLRTIADTLEQRRETRREVRTVLSESVTTGYTVLGMGLAVLPLLNLLSPGTVEEMTRTPIGIAVLVFSGMCFAVGVVAIRTLTRIEA